MLFASEPAEERHDEELQQNHTAESMPNSSAQLPDITRFTAGRGKWSRGCAIAHVPGSAADESEGGEHPFAMLAEGRQRVNVATVGKIDEVVGRE